MKVYECLYVSLIPSYTKLNSDIGITNHHGLQNSFLYHNFMVFFPNNSIFISLQLN